MRPKIEVVLVGAGGLAVVEVGDDDQGAHARDRFGKPIDLSCCLACRLPSEHHFGTK